MSTPDGVHARRTVQLRRYVLAAGVADEFVGWWREHLVPARAAYGFAIEFGYLVPETSEFVWAVSAEGDESTFAEVEAAYLASPERAAAFDGRPTWTTSQVITLVTPVG